MKFRFFAVPMLDGDEESQELNRFLSTNRVLQVERHFVSDGSRSAWAVCVSYLDRGGRLAHEQGHGKRLDYREILSESDFAVYAKLRSLRKSMAENDGLPAYTLFALESRHRCEAAYQAGTFDASQLQRAHDSALAITAHAETRAWFRARASDMTGVDWRDEV